MLRFTLAQLWRLFIPKPRPIIIVTEAAPTIQEEQEVVERAAILVASYYDGLKRGGISGDLLDSLTIDAHTMFLNGGE